MRKKKPVYVSPLIATLKSHCDEPHIQASHASWKVLVFFLENSRTWKITVPGKSWKLKLKVLESPGKNILGSHAFF